MSGHRRTRYALMTGALLACITGVGGLAIALGDRFPVRFDMTATRTHSLDERTQRLVDRLDAEHEIVVSADLAALEPSAASTLTDLLDAFDRQGNVRVTIIDSREALADLIGRLAQRERDAIGVHAGAIETVREQVGEARRHALALAEALGARTGTENAASALRTSADALSELDAGLAPLLASPFPGAELPEADRAAEVINDPGARLVTTLNAIERELQSAQRTAAGTDDAETAQWARSALGLLEDARNAMQRASDALRSLEPLEPLRLARALEQRELVLVIGPDRTTALDARSLVPAPDASSADALRTVREGERAIATALDPDAVRRPPIVVLVHGATQHLLGRDGRFAKELDAQFGALHDLLRNRRIGIAEWATAMSEPMPDRDALDPTGERPIVWMLTGVPSPGQQDRYARTLSLSSALERLERAGESLLLTVPPSDAERLGSADAIADIALAFGVDVRSGTPLVNSADTRDIFWRDVRNTEPDGPLSGALSNRPTYLYRPCPIDVLDPAPSGARISPLLVVPDDEGTWGESDWLNTAFGRGRPVAFDEGEDLDRASYVVALSATRARGAGEPSPTIPGAQRAVVVTGTDLWYSTAALSAVQEVDGSTRLVFPGNRALLDASISYLAGLDEQLTPTADLARIAPLSDGQVLALRLALIAGLPLGILVVGGVWRLARG